MIIKTESGSHEFAEHSCMADCLSAKKKAGKKIDDQAIAICNSECGSSKKRSRNSSPQFPDGQHAFSILSHWNQNKLSYELQILTSDKIVSLPFKSPNAPQPTQPIRTLSSSKEISCKCMGGVGDTSGVSRLFGEDIEGIDRDPDWFNFEGVTKNKEVYIPLVKGKVEVKNTELSTEFNFESDKLTGRWLLRTLPNIFDNGFIKGERMNLFWKPGNITKIQSLNSEELKMETTKITTTINSMLQGVTIDSRAKRFEVIVAAEGTWVDKFGVKFTYTPDFVKTLFNSMNRQMLEGTIPLGVDKEHSQIDEGKMDELELLDEPITHIRGRGFFNGEIGDVNGASIDAELDAVFSPTFQSWFPVNGVTKRVSLVASPACKVCLLLPGEQK